MSFLFEADKDTDDAYEAVRRAVLHQLKQAVEAQNPNLALCWANVYKLIEDAGYCTECE